VRSLRARLLAWLLGAVAVIGAAGGWFSYRHALVEANAFFDYHLQQNRDAAARAGVRLRASHRPAR
jgi:two-component system OmpR family sensor kinase